MLSDEELLKTFDFVEFAIFENDKANYDEAKLAGLRAVAAEVARKTLEDAKGIAEFVAVSFGGSAGGQAAWRVHRLIEERAASISTDKAGAGE